VSTRQPEELIATDDVIAIRLNGRPRSALDGRHRKVVVYATATLTTLDLAEILEETADRLMRPGAPPVASPGSNLR
jgi:hypothetical protein